MFSWFSSVSFWISANLTGPPCWKDWCRIQQSPLEHGQYHSCCLLSPLLEELGRISNETAKDSEQRKKLVLLTTCTSAAKLLAVGCCCCWKFTWAKEEIWKRKLWSLLKSSIPLWLEFCELQIAEAWRIPTANITFVFSVLIPFLRHFYCYAWFSA